MWYRTCPYCGAHLDPEENCDCLEAQEAQEAEAKRQAMRTAKLEALRADLEQDRKRKEQAAAARRQIRFDQLQADFLRKISRTATTA